MKNKEERLQVRISTDTKLLLEQYAKLNNKTVSRVIREAILKLILSSKKQVYFKETPLKFTQRRTSHIKQQ